MCPDMGLVSGISDHLITKSGQEFGHNSSAQMLAKHDMPLLMPPLGSQDIDRGPSSVN